MLHYACGLPALASSHECTLPSSFSEFGEYRLHTFSIDKYDKLISANNSLQSKRIGSTQNILIDWSN